jgi:hypothetical protein
MADTFSRKGRSLLVMMLILHRKVIPAKLAQTRPKDENSRC